MANASRRGILAALATAPATAAIGTPAPAGVSSELSALITTYREAARIVDAAEQADREAFRRFRAMGGEPERGPALFAHEGDRDLSLFATEHSRDGERSWFSHQYVEHLRRGPRQRAVIKYTTVKVGYPEHVRRRDGRPDGVVEYGYRTMEPWPEAQARADEIVAAYDWREAELERRLEISGCKTTSRHMQEVSQEETRALDAIRQFEPRNLADVVAKAAIGLEICKGPEGVRESLDDADCCTTEFAFQALLDLHRIAGGAS